MDKETMNRIMDTMHGPGEITGSTIYEEEPLRTGLMCEGCARTSVTVALGDSGTTVQPFLSPVRLGEFHFGVRFRDWHGFYYYEGNHVLNCASEAVITRNGIGAVLCEIDHGDAPCPVCRRMERIGWYILSGHVRFETELPSPERPSMATPLLFSETPFMFQDSTHLPKNRPP